MKRFLWLLLLPLCFGSWAAESEWNTDSVVVYYENQVIPVILSLIHISEPTRH